MSFAMGGTNAVPIPILTSPLKREASRELSPEGEVLRMAHDDSPPFQGEDRVG